jgi:putative colanic acid biosynthesis acetyltransferase WcaF
MQEENRTSRVRLKDFDATFNLDRGVPRWKEIAWYLTKVLFFMSALPYPNKFKASLLRLFGAKVGKGLIIKPRVNILFPWKLEIGNHVWIGEEVFILNFESLKIGNDVCISQRAFLCGGNHDYKDPVMTYRNGPITLQDGCWIGAASFIGPNVSIGVDTVITVGSVVTSSVADNLIRSSPPTVSAKPRW